MKMLYKCEICEKEFDNFDECMSHEKGCAEEHATGKRIEKELNQLFQSAVDKEIVVGVSGTNDQVFSVDCATYNVRTKKIFISIV